MQWCYSIKTVDQTEHIYFMRHSIHLVGVARSAYVRPREQLSLHQVDPSRLEALRLSVQPSGYESTARIPLPQLQVGPLSSASAGAAASSGETHIQASCRSSRY